MTSRQLTLFDAEPRSLAEEEDSVGGPRERAAGTEAVPDLDDRQIELFAHPVVLGREMEAALAAGRFELAARLRLVLDQICGPSLLTQALGFLDRLDTPLWEAPPAEGLGVWAEIDGQLAERTHLRARLREGFFARMLASHTPEGLVQARPECLPALAAVLASRLEGSPGAGRRRARALVRDALLAGRDLPSLDFRQDEAVADLLAEDFAPRWLACLGLIRRLWPAPPLDESELEDFRNTPAVVRSHEQTALEFWRCLRIGENADSRQDLLHEARRRLRRLSPDLHALYMRRANGRQAS